MLSLADKAVLERETALPSLKFLLDNEAVLDILNETWPALKIQDVQANYLRYKPLTSCLVRYDVTTAKGNEVLYVKTYPESATDKFAKARATIRSDYHRTVLEKACLILHRFPDDSKLKNLRVLHDERKQRFLQKMLPDYANPSVELLAYKPERRLVVKVTDEDKHAVLKFYNGDFEKVYRKAKQVNSAEAIRTSRVLNHQERYGVMALEWLEGSLLCNRLGSEAFDRTQLEIVGASLATLHQQKIDFPTPLPDVYNHYVQVLVDYLGYLQPNLKNRLYTLLEQTAISQGDSLVPLHGDFHSKQILVHKDSIALIDFDEAHRGAAAYDVGLFTAHLEVDAVRGFLSVNDAEAMKEHFLQGYEEVAGILPRDLAVFIARGILTLLPHFFRNRYKHWPDMTELLLSRAECVVKESQTKTFALRV